jgi:hypothetical protein
MTYPCEEEEDGNPNESKKGIFSHGGMLVGCQECGSVEGFEEGLREV